MNQEKFKKYAAIGITLVVCAVVAPFVALAIGGIVGIATAFVLGSVLLAAQPAFSQWATNMKFRALETVISYEPVLTLKTRAEERWKELDEQKTLLQTSLASLEDFRGKALILIKKFPEEAENMKQRLKDNETRAAFRVNQFKDAKKATEQFMMVIDKAEIIYQVAVAENAFDKSMGKKNDFMARFTEQTAFDAIDKANNQAMASLRMSLIDEDFVTEQIKLQETPVRAVNYTPAGNVNLGNILDITEITPENIRIKA